MWLAFTLIILPFVVTEWLKITEEKKRPAVHRYGKSYESDKSRHPE